MQVRVDVVEAADDAPASIGFATGGPITQYTVAPREVRTSSICWAPAAQAW